MSPAMVEVRNLGKTYGSVQAVKGVSFSVASGQVLGFLGPNGAGKTTVMKILTGYHFPSFGEALIDGISVEDEPLEVKKRIGYLPEMAPLYGELSVEEYLGFIASSRGLKSAEAKGAIDRSIEECGLPAFRKRRIETLSKGYKQRVGLAQAILSDPPILILDEPTTGLDPNQIIEIRSLIRRLGESKTVILSTHIMQEVEAVCNQVLILNEGKIAAQGTAAEISEQLRGGDFWELVLKGTGSDLVSRALPDSKVTLMDDAPEGYVKAQVTLPHSDDEYAEAEVVSDWAQGAGYKILGMTRKTLSLEDIFVKLTNNTEPAAKAKGGRK